VRKRCYVLTALLFCAVTIASGSNVNALKFTSIDFPGAGITEARGINALGHIVGSWEDPVTQRGHGFLLSEGVYQSFDVPGALGTSPQDINDNGLIVGSYSLAPEDGQICCETHGFVRTPDGQFVTITFPDVPGLPVTWLAGINNKRQIVGAYSEFDETILDTRGVHGFLFADGVFTQIDFPMPTPRVHVPVTFANDINEAGDIVGGYEDDVSETRRGYVLSGGVFSKIDVPRSNFTDAFSINKVGEIVGEYQAADGLLFSFLLGPKKGFRALELAGNDKRQISFLLATGINESSQIVGSYSDFPIEANPNRRLSLNIRLPVGHARARGNGKSIMETFEDGLLEDGSLHGFLARRSRP